MTELELTEKLKDFVKNECDLHYFNGYAFKYEIVHFSQTELQHIFFHNQTSTFNCLRSIMEQKKWVGLQHEDAVFDKLDGIYRWTSVNHSKQLIGLEHKCIDDKRLHDVYLLIRWNSNSFIGLKSKVCYIDGL